MIVIRRTYRLGNCKNRGGSSVVGRPRLERYCQVPDGHEYRFDYPRYADVLIRSSRHRLPVSQGLHVMMWSLDVVKCLAGTRSRSISLFHTTSSRRHIYSIVSLSMGNLHRRLIAQQKSRMVFNPIARGKRFLCLDSS